MGDTFEVRGVGLVRLRIGIRVRRFWRGGQLWADGVSNLEKMEWLGRGEEVKIDFVEVDFIWHVHLLGFHKANFSLSANFNLMSSIYYSSLAVSSCLRVEREASGVTHVCKVEATSESN